MKYKYLCILLFISVSGNIVASHYRGGEILYTYQGGFTYTVTVVTYTKISGISITADRDKVALNWGDGTTDSLPRINGPINGNGFPNGVVVLPDVKKNMYQGTHTYPGKPPNGFFIISFFDVNRLGGIININNSFNISFYLEDTLFFPTSNDLIGQFSSPVLANPAVQYANYCDTFITNPEAIDSAADSITYVLQFPCKQDQNNNINCFIFPDAYCNAVRRLPGPTQYLHHRFPRGNFTWAEPCDQGFF